MEREKKISLDREIFHLPRTVLEVTCMQCMDGVTSTVIILYYTSLVFEAIGTSVALSSSKWGVPGRSPQSFLIVVEDELSC